MVKKIFREIDFTSFFGLDFFNFLVHCELPKDKGVNVVSSSYPKVVVQESKISLDGNSHDTEELTSIHKEGSSTASGGHSQFFPE